MNKSFWNCAKVFSKARRCA